MKEWVLSVCFVIAATGIYSYLCPDKRYEKILNLVTAAVFLLCLMSPVASLLGDGFSFELDGVGIESVAPSDLETQKQGQLMEEVKVKSEQLVMEKLSASGINPLGLGIDIELEEDELKVTGCTVLLSEKDEGQRGSVTDIIRRELRITPDIKVVTA